MKYILFLIFFTINIVQAFSQNFTIAGTVQSETDKSTFPGATIMLMNPIDSTIIKGVVTGIEGEFKLDNIKPGSYVVKISFIGFVPFFKSVDVQDNLDLGLISLHEEVTTLQEFVVIGEVPPSVQKGDTVQFNASAFKTMNDASAQNLIEKMPGITQQNGKIQAQGEDIQQILVDGKPFFGNDVQAALQNLPAEVIASIQIFDKKSDKAELSGFDDGERLKTINIITKPNRKKGQFGKASVGYGSNDRYMAGASVNLFNNDRRITITGLSNNINAINYSADPNSQGETRTQDGIITSNILGLNFSDKWGKKVEISGSYLFSQRENEGNQSLSRNYIASDSAQVYTEDNSTNRKNMDHNLNIRFEYNIDSNNRVLIRPNISLKHDDNNTYFLGGTDTENGPLNQTENSLNSTNKDYDFDNSLYYSHRFRKKGRSFTFGLNTGFHSNEDEANRIAHNTFYREEDKDETLNQQTLLNRTGLSWNTELSYTEPIGKRGQMELEYEIGNRIDDSDKRTFDLFAGEPADQNRLLDTALSNTFKSEYLTQEFELGYQYSTEKMRVQVEGGYQNAAIKNDQVFPLPFDIERTFQSLLPTVRFDYKFSKTKSVEIDYDTRTREPSIGQLQSVIDNSNPLQLRTGNPNLNQSYQNQIRARYRGNNPKSHQSFFVYLSTSFIKNTIANSTTIAAEPIELEQGIILERGSQLSRPVNLQGYRDFRSYVSYGRPIGFIKSNIGFNGSINYTHNPGMINNEINFVNTGNYRLGLSLSSNISEKVDFNFYTRGSYNVVQNTLRPALNNNYFNQTTRFNFNWLIWKGLIYRIDVNHQLNRGLAEAYNNDFLLMNMSIGKKFLKNERAEISLNVYDLLGQNNNIRRNVTELYVEDSQSNVLQRYFMLTLTYNLRHFSAGASEKDFEKHED